MRIVRWTLRIAAILCLSGLIGVFVPMGALASVLAEYGMPQDPSPFLAYVFRLSAAVTASCGLFFLYMSRDPARHGGLVPLGGGAVLFVGTVLLFTGLGSDMASQVVVMDFLSCVLVGSAVILTWLLWGRGREEREEAAGAAKGAKK